MWAAYPPLTHPASVVNLQEKRSFSLQHIALSAARPGIAYQNQGHTRCFGIIRVRLSEDSMNDNQLLDLTVRAHTQALVSLRKEHRAKVAAHANPLLRHGEKYFSQNDEDGILLEIVRRIGLDSKATFLECGVGNGLENNTLILLMSGWRGAWVGGEELAFALPEPSRRLLYTRVWITPENAFTLYTEAAQRLGVGQFSVMSIDLDGNDYHILADFMYRGAHPSVIVLEYNGKFPPPIRFTVDYDPSNQFDGTDYTSASLQTFYDLLDGYGYALVACNITGVNAFFVDKKFLKKFSDVPPGIEDLFVPTDYACVTGIGHPPSARTIAHFLKERLVVIHGKN
jgi:hypothetical protein